MALADVAAEALAQEKAAEQEREAAARDAEDADALDAVRRVLVMPNGAQVPPETLGMVPLTENVAGQFRAWTDGQTVLMAVRNGDDWTVAVGRKPNERTPWVPSQQVHTLADIGRALA